MNINLEDLSVDELKILKRQIDTRMRMRGNTEAITCGLARFDKAEDNGNEYWRVGVMVDPISTNKGQKKPSRLLGIVKSRKKEELLPKTKEIIRDLQGLVELMEKDGGRQ